MSASLIGLSRHTSGRDLGAIGANRRGSTYGWVMVDGSPSICCRR